MLTDVTIEGLRGVGRVELCFKPEQRVYVLFGENGVGKTKCLEALYQFLLASNKDFARDYWAKNRNQPVSRHVAVMARMHDKSSGMQLEVPEQGESFQLEQVWKGEIHLHRIPVIFIGAGRRASLVGEKVTHSDLLGAFQDRQQIYFDALYDALNSTHLSSMGMTGSTRTWFIQRAQSANPYQKSKDNRETEIRSALFMLNAIDSRIDPDFLKIDGRGLVFLSVDGKPREFGELSSGFAALVKLVQAIIAGYAAFTNETKLQNVRGIVLIDEIEAHLHPKWQTNIIPCLKKLLPNTTFYVATHAPLVLTRLKDGEAYLLERDKEDGVVRSRIVEGTSRRLLADMLKGAFKVNANALKRQAMEEDDQTEAKRELLKLLETTRGAKA